MYKAFFTIFFISLTFVSFTQNLIMNPGFEEYWVCPTQAANVEDCKWVFNPMCDLNNITTRCLATSDYFNTCASVGSNVNVPNTYTGYQQPFEGNAYIGIGNYSNLDTNYISVYREYAQIKLSEKLVAGGVYQFSFYANLVNESHITTNQVGAKFVKDSVVYFPYLWQIMEGDWVSNTYITDTLGWQKLEGEYVANGGEEWMIIGIFYQDSVFPYRIVNPNANPAWENYFYFYIDGGEVEFTGKTVEFPNVFTPNGDGANDNWNLPIDVEYIRIYNRWGKKVWEENESFNGWSGNTQTGKECPDGVYYFIANAYGNQYKGTITLLR